MSCSCSNHFAITEGNKKILDIPATFSSRGKPVVLAKIILTCWVISQFIYSFLDSEDFVFFFAYLTHWSLIFAVIYMIASLFNSVFPANQPELLHKTTRPSIWICFTWIMSEIAFHSAMLVTLLFWYLEFDPNNDVITYKMVMTHGGIAILVAIDSLFLNRVPVRLKHVIFVMMVDLAFILWTVVHAYTNIGNPNKEDNDPATNDDAIYGSLTWKDSWKGSLLIAVIAEFVVSPLLFVIMWVLCRYSFPWSFSGENLKYVIESKNESEESVNKNQTVEEDDDSEKGMNYITVY